MQPDSESRSPMDTEAAVVASVRAAADEIHDPCSMAIGLDIGLGEMGLVREITVSQVGSEWDVHVRIRLTSPGCQYFFYFQEQMQARLLAQPGIVSARVTWDDRLDWTPEDISLQARRRIEGRMRRLPSIPAVPTTAE